MKASDKVSLLLKGISLNDIKALEEEELQEAARVIVVEDASKDEEKDIEPVADLTAVLNEKDEKIVNLEKELADLKKQISINNATGKTIKDNPDPEYDAVAVFTELYK